MALRTQLRHSNPWLDTAQAKMANLIGDSPFTDDYPNSWTGMRWGFALACGALVELGCMLLVIANALVYIRRPDEPFRDGCDIFVTIVRHSTILWICLFVWVATLQLSICRRKGYNKSNALRVLVISVALGLCILTYSTYVFVQYAHFGHECNALTAVRRWARMTLVNAVLGCLLAAVLLLAGSYLLLVDFCVRTPRRTILEG